MNKTGCVKRMKKKPTSALGEPCWAVIGDSYLSTDKTYDQARAEADDLKRRRQPGVVVVTNEVAKRILSNAPADK